MASSPKSASVGACSTWTDHCQYLRADCATLRSIPGVGIFAGLHTYNYARWLPCSAAVSFVLCALYLLRQRPSFQAYSQTTTQIPSPYTPPTCCEEECASRNLLTTTINSRPASQLSLACIGKRAATLADIICNLLNLLTTTAVIGSCRP
ncbi:hypothetical protein M3J09_012680 [Ascochyta lentis]